MRVKWLNHSCHRFSVCTFHILYIVRRSPAEFHFYSNDQICLISCHSLTAAPHLAEALLEATGSASPALLHLTAHGQPGDSLFKSTFVQANCLMAVGSSESCNVIRQGGTRPSMSWSKDNSFTTSTVYIFTVLALHGKRTLLI